MNEKRVLFVQDAHMYYDDSGNYFGIHIDEDIKQRYLMLGTNLTVLTRLEKISQREADKFSLIKPQNFNHVEIPNFKSIRGFLGKRKKAIKIIKNEVKNHDVIVVRLPSASGNIAAEYAKKISKPLLVEMVGCTFDGYWNYNWKGKLIAHYKLWKQKKVIKNCTDVIYVTSEFLQKRYPTKGRYTNISNVKIVSHSKVKAEKKRERLKFLNLQEDKLVIATIASLDVPYKGQKDVIKALKLLKKIGTKKVIYKLVGQGKGAELAKLIKKLNIDDQVEIVGPIMHEKIFDFLDGVDLYIQPSKQEGLPRALIEAMSRGCPALGARTAGIPELLQSDCIFQPGNYKQIANKIKSIDNNWLCVKSKANFQKSLEFGSVVLNKRRKKFFDEFLKLNKFKDV